MNTQQTVILIFVLVIGVLAAVSIFQGDGPASDGPSAENAAKLGVRSESRVPDGWDLSRLPDVGTPVRSFTTKRGVHVQVIDEGDASLPAINLGRPLDLRVHLFLLNGVIVQNDVVRGLVYGQQRPGLDGLMEGLIDIRPYERRRILVPNEMAHGHRQVGNVPAHADVVYDVRWVYFKIDELREGTGKVANLGSKVLVNYRGRLEDGTVFEQTPDGTPAEFTLKSGGVIEGFRVGIRGMKEGGERRLWIPSHMAYRDERRQRIPPHANLIFVVELVKVLD